MLFLLKLNFAGIMKSVELLLNYPFVPFNSFSKKIVLKAYAKLPT